MNKKNNSLISRSKNHVILSNGFVRKTSDDISKINSEFLWLDLMKNNLYIPSVNKIENGYEIRFIDGDNLGQTFYSLNYFQQKNIIDIYIDFIYLNRKIDSNAELARDINSQLLKKKFISRLNEMNGNKLFSKYIYLYDKYLEHIDLLIESLDNKSYGVMHGDLFFGNTLYNGIQLYFIDPRGYDEINGVNGSIFYDIVKLAHSVHGKYDNIIFNKKHHKNFKKINNYFFKYIYQIFGYSKDQILLAEMGLFLSMIPLHSDSTDRQLKLLEIAVKIDKEIKWKNL